jgi:hypothetical protein
MSRSRNNLVASTSPAPLSKKRPTGTMHSKHWSPVGLQFSFLWKSSLLSIPPKPDGIYAGVLDLPQLSRVLVAL